MGWGEEDVSTLMQSQTADEVSAEETEQDESGNEEGGTKPPKRLRRFSFTNQFSNPVINFPTLMEFDNASDLVDHILKGVNYVQTLVEQNKNISVCLPSNIEREINNLGNQLASIKSFHQFIERFKIPNSMLDAGYFGILPIEIKLHILSFLSVRDIGSILLTSREWSKLANDEILWQGLCSRDFCVDQKPEIRTWKWIYQSHHIIYSSPPPRSKPGTFVYMPEGHKYIGDWKDNHRDGYGIFVWSDNRRYSGQWRNDKRNDYGRYTYPDGTSYEGQWKDDKRNGLGTYSWPDGRQYTGEWSNHRKNGRGVHVWPDGSRYTGQWCDGSRNGRGTFFWENGRKYDGEWENGRMKGNGTFTWIDGDKYIGEWLEGRRWGKGVLVCTDGRVYKQEWRETRFDKSNKGEDIGVIDEWSSRKRKVTENSESIENQNPLVESTASLIDSGDSLEESVNDIKRQRLSEE